MRIAATSDLHGFFPDVPDCDVLVIAGDIIGAISTEEERAQWMEFKGWLLEMRVRDITTVLVAGNHDFALQNGQRFADALGVDYYLEDQGCTINGVRFYGSPWQPWFHNWAFNAPQFDTGEEFLERKFERIPANTDVLVTHSPPAGFHDRVGGRNCGSLALNRHVQRVRPKLHTFGHIHHGFGVSHVEGVTLANVSHTKTEGGRYHPLNDPVVFDL